MSLNSRFTEKKKLRSCNHDNWTNPIHWGMWVNALEKAASKVFSCETCRSSSADVIQTKPATDPICVTEVGLNMLDGEAQLLYKVTYVNLYPRVIQILNSRHWFRHWFRRNWKNLDHICDKILFYTQTIYYKLANNLEQRITTVTVLLLACQLRELAELAECCTSAGASWLACQYANIRNPYNITYSSLWCNVKTINTSHSVNNFSLKLSFYILHI